MKQQIHPFEALLFVIILAVVVILLARQHMPSLLL